MKMASDARGETLNIFTNMFAAKKTKIYKKVATPEIEQQGLKQWSFDDRPKETMVR